MKRLGKDARNPVLLRALELAKKGISVIPVQGDAAPREPKKPATRWRAYQKRIMNAAEVRAAFSKVGQALGIVCGRVSGLVVIDFDDHLRYRRFCRFRPDLAESYTVKTRRGYHVYFRTDEKVPTHQFDGGDIKGERSYVVAPPSIVDGFAYREACRKEAIRLDRGGIDSLMKHLHIDRYPLSVAGNVRRERNEEDLRTLYERLAPRIGRNNALYRVASLARDRGLFMAEAELRLTDLHAQAPGGVLHRVESVVDRMGEAQRTIRSAYRRPSGNGSYSEGLPNSVREQLLKEQDSSVFARFLDVLRLEGWQAERYFSAGEAISVAESYGLNRKSVLQCLTGELSTFNGRQIIARRYVEYLDIGGLYSRKRGRPVELYFQVPSVGRLLWVLNVRMSPSDRIEARDVRTAHAYRLALHREYIRRLSPRLPLRVMAERLGVNVRSLRRYNLELGVRSTAYVGRMDLTWATLRCLPKRRRSEGIGSTAGYWLETREGYRAPAWQHIGVAMLRRDEGGVQICARGTSMWSLAAEACLPLQYESLSVDDFVRLRVRREGGADEGGIVGAARRIWDRARSWAMRVRYERVRLSYESVGACIAEDKVAESIGGYLVARDEVGRVVRRPARRGVAYRMLKEFGEGNVYLALRECYREMLVALAGHAVDVEDRPVSADLLAPMLA